MYRGVRRAGEGQGGRRVTQGDSHARSRLNRNRMVLRWHKQRNVVVENGPASTIVPIEPSRNGVSVCSVLLNGRTRSRTSNGAIYIEIIDRYRTERIYQMKFLTMYDRMKALLSGVDADTRRVFAADRRARPAPGRTGGGVGPGNGNEYGARDDCAPGPATPYPGKIPYGVEAGR